MIGKVMHNSSFRATTRYVIEKSGATLIGGSVAGDSVKELVAEFMWSNDLNPGLKHPVWHMSLSLPHDEHLSDDQFSDLATQYFAGMVLLADDHKLVADRDRFRQRRDEFVLDGLSEYQYLVARHSDQEHDHVHIVASRINLNTGNGVELWRDKTRNQKILRCLEVEYGLTPVQNSWDVGKKSATKGQLEKQVTTGEASIQSRLQELIEVAAIGQPEMPEMFERLMRQGVEVRHGWTRTGKSKGISYSLEDVAFAGNQLGGRYSFPDLQKHLGVDYQADRDDEQLRSLIDNGILPEPERLRSLIENGVSSEPEVGPLTDNDVPSEPDVDLQQRRELAQAVARSAMRILQLVGKTNAQGQIVRDHERGNYRLMFDPAAGDLVIESKQTGEVILAGRARKLDVAQSRLTEMDLQRFQVAEQRIEQAKQAQQEREKQAKRDRGFEM
jgi:Relaxase/Mobilisation nuclease domain